MLKRQSHPGAPLLSSLTTMPFMIATSLGYLLLRKVALVFCAFAVAMLTLWCCRPLPVSIQVSLCVHLVTHLARQWVSSQRKTL